MERVLLLIKGLARGGAEQLLASAAAHRDTARFGYEVAYLLPGHDALAVELQRRGLSVRCLYGERGVGWMHRLRALVREREIRLVHVHSPYAAVGARLALELGRTRLVYTEHNVWESYHRATYLANAITFARNDHVFTVSHQVSDSIRYPWPLRSRAMPPLEVLHHGVDAAALQSIGTNDGVREELGIPGDAPIVGTVANFKPNKGHRYLLDAAVRVRRAVPDVRFVLVGQGPLEDETRRRAQQMGLQGTVVFTGPRDDVPRLARAFDVFALSSIHEGLSIALIEAMALGKASIVTRAGGLPELIEDGREGLLVPPRDSGALASGIIALLDDRTLRTALGRAARRRAADFDIRSAVRRMERVYEGLLA